MLVINEKGPPSSHALHTCTERDKKQEAENRFLSSFHVHLFVPPDSWLQLLLNSSLLWCLQVLLCCLSLSRLWVCLSLISFPLFMSFHFISCSLIFLTLPLSLFLSSPNFLALSLYLNLPSLYLESLYFFVPLYHCVSLWALGGCWLLPLCSRWSIRPLFPAHKALGCHSRRPWHVLVPSPSDACAQRCSNPSLYCWAVRASLTLCHPLVGLQSYLIILFHPIHAVLFGSAFETVKHVTNPDSRLLIIQPLF